MPWGVADVEAHRKGLSDKMKELWVSVANAALSRCEADKGADCEASAIKQANAVVAKRLKESSPLAAKLAEAIADARVGDTGLVEAWLPAGVSVQGLLQKVEAAVKAKGNPSGGQGIWVSVQELFEDAVIYNVSGPISDYAYFKAPLTVAKDGAVTVGDPVKVERKTVYEEISEAQQPTEEAILVESTFLEASVSGLGPVEFSPDGTIPICIIQPGQGSSAYYEKEQLKRDGGIFKDSLSFFDHQTSSEERERPEGSILNVAGKVVESGWSDSGFKGPGVYGKMFVIQPHREFVSHVAPLTGLSIRASGKTVEKDIGGKRTKVAERFTKAVSVDLVTAAGAGGQVGTLTESARPAIQAFVDLFAKEHPIIRDVAAGGSGIGIAEFVEWARTTNRTQEDSMAEEAKVATLTTEVTQLKEANKRLGDEKKALEERLILREVADIVATELAKEKDLPEITKTRLAEVLKRETPLKEGKLDAAALTAKIGEAVKSEKAYLAALAPTGIKGMGATDAASDAAGKARLREARIKMYIGQGKSKELAEKLAEAGGR